MSSCVVCTNNDINVLCPKCEKGICLICFTKVSSCPFCRMSSFGLLECEIEDTEDEDNEVEDTEDEDENEPENFREIIIKEQLLRERRLHEQISQEQKIQELQIQERILQMSLQDHLIKQLLKHNSKE